MIHVVQSKPELSAIIEKNPTVIVDFYADWCAPCKVIAPIIEEMSEKVTVVKVNVDDSPELSNQYAVRSIPTVLVIQDGEVQNTIVGAGIKALTKIQEELN